VIALFRCLRHVVILHPKSLDVKIFYL